jgi:hypothetical protein
MIRVTPRSTCSPQGEFREAIIVYAAGSPSSHAAAALVLGPHPTEDDIRLALGTKKNLPVRCLTRRDGLISAYCVGSSSTSQHECDNPDAAKIARAYGICVPEEALPFRGPVLFLGAPDCIERHARKSKP